MTHEVMQPLVLVLGALVVAGAARRLKVSAPLVLVVVGLAVSFVPGVPDFELDPTVVLNLFLPPLLFSAALTSSFVSLRQNIRPVLLLSVGLVLFTVVVVGLSAYVIVPALSLPAALTLGAIVAPPDAVAATSIGRSVGLPKRMVSLLGGESLFNDATALTSYKVAVSAAAGMGFSFVSGGGQLLWATVVGLAVGLAVGWAVIRLTTLLHDSVLENALWLATPLIAYLPAEEFRGAGVLAVVIAGLYLGWNQTRTSFATRLQSGSVWRVVDLVLESLVFALIGLQLPSVVRGLSGRTPGEVVVASIVVLLLVIGSRFAYIFPTIALGKLLRRADLGKKSASLVRPSVVLSWAGMRGVVSLAAASGLPSDFPERDLVVFLTFVVTVATLLLQGSTLAPLIRQLGLARAGATDAEDAAQQRAQHEAARAALDRLDDILSDGDRGSAAPQDLVQRLRQRTRLRLALTADERDEEEISDDARETPAYYRWLRQEMLDAERETFVRLRNDGSLDDEAFRSIQLELDLEQAILYRD